MNASSARTLYRIAQHQRRPSANFRRITTGTLPSVRMPDEVAALPRPSSNFPQYVRAAARPDVRTPRIHPSITHGSRTKQSSGSALVCSSAPAGDSASSTQVIGKNLLGRYNESYLPNVKDEPRPQLARRVPHTIQQSTASLLFSLNSTRRDSCGRWLWRLVGPFPTTAYKFGAIALRLLGFSRRCP
jgi:hypothetical protein